MRIAGGAACLPLLWCSLDTPTPGFPRTLPFPWAEAQHVVLAEPLLDPAVEAQVGGAGPGAAVAGHCPGG